jgi:hypothetical protein
MLLLDAPEVMVLNPFASLLFDSLSLLPRTTHNLLPQLAAISLPQTGRILTLSDRNHSF